MPDQFDPYHVWLGIPPEEQPPNHYRLLSLRPFESNRDVISNAVDQRRVFLRSVQGGKRAAQSQQLMNEVSAAGVVLLDPARKARYDEELKKKLSPRPAHVQPSGAGLSAGGLPDPMAPLAISDLLPQQAAVAVKPRAPGVNSAAATSQAPRPSSGAAPVILTAPPLRPVRRSLSPGALAGILVAAGLAVVIIVGSIAFMAKRGAPTSDAVAAATSKAESPPSLPPPPAAAGDLSASGSSSLPPNFAQPKESNPAVATSVPPAPAAGAAVRKKAKMAEKKPAEMLPANSASAPPATNPVSAAKPLPVGGRVPVPDGDALSSAEEAARKLFAKELKEATRPPQQIALATEIMNSGRATQNDYTSRFALIDLARTLFIQAGEVDQALTAARLLEIEYDVPREHLVSATLEALEGATMTPEQRMTLTKTAAELADTAVASEEFDRADKLSALAVQFATKLKDADVRKDLQQRRNRIQKIVKEWNVVKVGLDKLKGDPQDAAANLAAGKFYCLLLEDFHRGLRYLAAGSDPLLSEAAKLDAAAENADGAKRLEAAQAWQKAEAKIADRESKLAAQRRERWLLQQALPSLSGIEQIKVNKRLADLSEIGGIGSKGNVPAPAMPNKTKKKKTT